MQLCCRQTIAYLIVLLILACSFVAILWLAHVEIMYSRVFPQVDCNQIDAVYGNQLE